MLHANTSLHHMSFESIHTVGITACTDDQQPAFMPCMYNYIRQILNLTTLILQVLATVHHINSGQLDGHVYTNGWPEFSTVVARYKEGFSQWVCGQTLPEYNIMPRYFNLNIIIL